MVPTSGGYSGTVAAAPAVSSGPSMSSGSTAALWAGSSSAGHGSTSRRRRRTRTLTGLLRCRLADDTNRSSAPRTLTGLPGRPVTAARAHSDELPREPRPAEWVSSLYRWRSDACLAPGGACGWGLRCYQGGRWPVILDARVSQNIAAGGARPELRIAQDQRSTPSCIQLADGFRRRAATSTK